MRRNGVIASAMSVLIGTILMVGVPSSVQAEVISRSGSVQLDSLPGTQPIIIEKFDPSLGTLDSITVTAFLDGGIDATVWNLTTQARNTTVTFTASALANGPGGVDLTVGIADSSSIVLPAGGSLVFSLSDTDDSSTTTSAAVDLAAFSGIGTVTFNLTGMVNVGVVGPAKWRTRGVASARATVTVDYDYSPPTTSTTTLPPTTTSTSTTSTTMPATTTTTTPPSVCPTSLTKQFIRSWGNAPFDIYNGQMTIERVYFNNDFDPIAFDWSSPQPISYIEVGTYNYEPNNPYSYVPPATSGTNLVGLPNADGSPARLKSLWVCLEDAGPTTTVVTTTDASTTTAVTTTDVPTTSEAWPTTSEAWPTTSEAWPTTTDPSTGTTTVTTDDSSTTTPSETTDATETSAAPATHAATAPLGTDGSPTD